VIIITTKKASDRRLLVLDNETGMPLEGATVQIRQGTESVIFTTDRMGEVQAKGFAIKKNFKATLTCVAYEPQETDIRWNRAEDCIVIRMQPKISNLDEVRVVVFPTNTCKWHTSRCRMAECVIARSDKHIDVKPKSQPNVSFIFPNPAAPGSTVTIRASEGLSKVDLLNVNGQLIRSVMLNQEKHSFQLLLTAISTGIYFIRMYHTNGRPADTQKLIIQ
jgi:hypothetical protein